MADCERALDLLSAKIDGELSQTEEAELTAHLEHCESCRQLASELESVHAGLQSFAVSPPAGLADGIFDKIKEESTPPQEAKTVSMAPRQHTWKIWLSVAAAFLFIVGGIRFLPLFAGVNSGSSMSASVPAPFPSVSESQEKTFGSEYSDKNKSFDYRTAAGEEQIAEDGSDSENTGAASKSAVSDTAGAGTMQSAAPEINAPESSTSDNNEIPESEMTFQAVAGSRGMVLTAQSAAEALSIFLYPEGEINTVEQTDEEGNFTGLSVTDKAGNSLSTLEYQGETEDAAAFRFSETKEGSGEEILWQVTIYGGEITEITK